MKSAAASHPSESELRAFALSFPGTREDFPWGESAFKVGAKVFVFLYVHAGGLKISLKLPRSNELALAQPFAEPTGYGLGKSGWVTCTFEPRERVPMALVKGWIDESYRAVAPTKLLALLARPDAPVARQSATGQDTVTTPGPKRPVRRKVTKNSPRVPAPVKRKARKNT